MKRQITRQVRDRYLTPEEVAKYRALREQIEAEKPEISARFRSQLKIAAPGKVFEPLAENSGGPGSEPGGAPAADGIEAAVLSRLENGEEKDFTVGTAELHAQALGKQLTFGTWDAGASPTQSALAR